MKIISNFNNLTKYNSSLDKKTNLSKNNSCYINNSISSLDSYYNASNIKLFSKGIGFSASKSIYFEDFEYLQELANDMSCELNTMITPNQLKSVMGKEEFLDILPDMKEENFCAYHDEIDSSNKIKRILNQKNIEKGIYKVDLHSHTRFSDGAGDVSQILENITQYANSLHEKTGEKFIFSITDHDGINGSKEALKLIAENPEKYENIRFVPGIELSFAHETDNPDTPIAVSELLAHCINPYSEKTNKFINQLLSNRKDMIYDTTSDLSSNIKDVKFDANEINYHFINIPQGLYAYSLHYRISNYAQIKQMVTQVANQTNKNPEVLYQELLSKWEKPQYQRTPEEFKTFLKNNNIDTSKLNLSRTDIDTICKKHYPKSQNNKIISSSERTFDEIINFFSNDNKTVLGFAHPAFLTRNYIEPEKALINFVKNSNGLIKTVEKYHQSYHIPIQKGIISKDLVDKTNESTEQLNLINIGGHDNHAPFIIPKQ